MRKRYVVWVRTAVRTWEAKGKPMGEAKALRYAENLRAEGVEAHVLEAEGRAQ